MALIYLYLAKSDRIITVIIEVLLLRCFICPNMENSIGETDNLNLICCRDAELTGGRKKKKKKKKEASDVYY